MVGILMDHVDHCRWGSAAFAAATWPKRCVMIAVDIV